MFSSSLIKSENNFVWGYTLLIEVLHFSLLCVLKKNADLCFFFFQLNKSLGIFLSKSIQ